MFKSHDFDFGLAFGVGAGIFIFFKGLGSYREYLVLKDTPESTIRSIPMGLVEIHGKANGEQQVRSPVTGTLCLYYKVVVEQWSEGEDKGEGHWMPFKSDTGGPLFYLEDATGKALVNAHSAELDLASGGEREIDLKNLQAASPAAAQPAAAGAGGTVTDAELSGYLHRIAAGAALDGPVHFNRDDSPEVKRQKARQSEQQSLNFLKSIALGGNPSGVGTSRYRLTEYLILPGESYDITGTCTENPHPKDENDRNLIVKGQNDPTFLISTRSEKALETDRRKKAMQYVLGGAALAVGCLVTLLLKLGML